MLRKDLESFDNSLCEGFGARGQPFCHFMGGVDIDFDIPEPNHIIHFFRHTMIGRLPAESNKNIFITVGFF